MALLSDITDYIGVAKVPHDRYEELFISPAMPYHFYREPVAMPRMRYKGKKQIFITQGVYRLKGRQTGKFRIQLDGNAWKFRKRHYPRLEILGSDAPTYRPSNNTSFKVKVSKVRVKIPTREKHPR